jgi:hypothetical protein
MPKAKSATGVHYDQLFLRHGPPTAITAWIPIGDCPPQGGGLMYLDDSLGLGRDLEEGFTRLSEEKHLTDDERNSAYNSNVSDTTRDETGWWGGDSGGGCLENWCDDRADDCKGRPWQRRGGLCA